MINKINSLVFAGTPMVAALVFEQLINQGLNFTACYTKPDTPKGRGQKISYSPVKNIALQYNIKTIQPDNFRNSDHIKILQQLNPDVIIVFAYGLILPETVLAIPKFGCINIHASLLPRWRGAAPVQHAILAGDQQTGITIMQMTKGLDQGPILYRQSCLIEPADNSYSLLHKMLPLAVNGVLQTIALINNNNLIATRQDDSLASYAHKITKEQTKINWQSSAIVLDRSIRAFAPEPGAITNIANIENIKIIAANAVSNNNHNNYPGEIIEITKQYIAVATLDGILRITKLKLPGSKSLTIQDLLNASKYNAIFKLKALFY